MDQNNEEPILSKFLQGVTTRFGGIKNRHLVSFSDGKTAFVDETNQGAIVFSFSIKVSDKFSIESVEIRREANVKETISSISTDVPKVRSTTLLHKLNVDLDPTEKERSDFILNELKSLLLDLEEQGFNHSHCTFQSEIFAKGTAERVDMFFFTESPLGLTVLASAAATAAVPRGKQICLDNMLIQLKPLLPKHSPNR